MLINLRVWPEEICHPVRPLCSVGLRTAYAGNMGAATVAHVARNGRLRIDAVI